MSQQDKQPNQVPAENQRQQKSDRPQGNQGGKPHHEKSHHDKQHHNKHQSNKPHHEKPHHEKPHHEKPHQDNPHQAENRRQDNRRPDNREQRPPQRPHENLPQERSYQERPYQERAQERQQRPERTNPRGDRRENFDRRENTERHEQGSYAGQAETRAPRGERRSHVNPYVPEFIPTHSGFERPEQLEEMVRRGFHAQRIEDPPYVPDKPAKGSDDIFYKDFHPLFSTARGLAIKILTRLDQSDSYLDKLLEYELAHCDLKPVDRALLTELVHGVTRWQARLDWILTGFYHGEFVKCIVPVKNAMRIALYQIMFLQRIPPFAAVSESVELIKRLKGNRSGNLVNAILRNILNNINNIRYPIRNEDVARHLSIFYSHPFWMVKRWLARYGEEGAENLLKVNNERPKIAIRMNMMRCKPDELKEFLQIQDVKQWDAPFEADRFLLVGSLSAVREWKPFNDGWFSVQDLSAAMVVRLANPQSGQRVYDLCAAPGGKITFAAELMNDNGTLVALDKYAGKLKIIQENTERLQLASVSTQAHDARTFAPKEQADLVMVDAPCSGLGTLAKKPDIKWKFETTDFPALVRTQREILTNAAKLVKPGGALVYSTCTIEPEENTEQVAWFLKEFPNFELDTAEKYLPESVCKDGCMQTLPHVHQIDGAFAARFLRKK